MYCRLVYEGVTDWPLLKTMMLAAGWPETSLLPDNKRGKTNIDAALVSLANEAKTQPVIIVRDLDLDAPCAPAWLKQRHATAPWLTLRLAVRSIEAWFLADRRNAAQCLRVTERLIPKSPDSEANAKLTLVALARKSTNQAITNRVVPKAGFSAAVGSGYVQWFEASCASWNLGEAEKHSDSLKRAVKAFELLRIRYEAFLRGEN